VSSYFAGLSRGRAAQWADDQTAIVAAQLAEREAKADAESWRKLFLEADAEYLKQDKTYDDMAKDGHDHATMFRNRPPGCTIDI
jgi:hypothetical protein